MPLWSEVPGGGIFHFFLCALCSLQRSLQHTAPRPQQFAAVSCCSPVNWILIYFNVIFEIKRELESRWWEDVSQQLLCAHLTPLASISSQFMVCWIVVCLAEHTELVRWYIFPVFCFAPPNKSRSHYQEHFGSNPFFPHFFLIVSRCCGVDLLWPKCSDRLWGYMWWVLRATPLTPRHY